MRCPICKKPIDEAEKSKPNSAYPFCSDRCKLIDLGRWLDGSYQIPVTPEDPEEPTPRSEPGEK